MPKVFTAEVVYLLASIELKPQIIKMFPLLCASVEIKPTAVWKGNVFQEQSTIIFDQYVLDLGSILLIINTSLIFVLILLDYLKQKMSDDYHD